MRFFLLVFIVSFSAVAQQYKITYSKSSNGTLVQPQDATIIIVDATTCFISSESILANKANFPYEQTVVSGKTAYQSATLNSAKTVFTIDSVAISKQNFELLNETKTILGYTCKKAKTIINSNTIELWYTTELNLKGAPSVLGQSLGLVLESNRNGNYVVKAEKIEKLKKPFSAIPLATKEQSLDLLTYRDMLWKSRFTTMEIFKNEIINFTSEAQSNDSIFRFANGTIVVRKIHVPTIKQGSQVFVDLTEQSNGDAYDRTGSVFLIPVTSGKTFWNGLLSGVTALPEYNNGNGKKYQGIVATKDYTPLVELMRFFTPFGIKQYNHIELKGKEWENQSFYRQDISALLPAFSEQEVYLGVFIGNYDKGGHKISLNLTIHPEEIETKAQQVIPLFNTTNIMEMAGQEYGTLFNSDKGLEVQFTLTQPLKNACLRYISTGHGGWENGDEFVKKTNTLFLDNNQVYQFIPWREDCGAYRVYNPASGNFPNGLSSSDYSRSNWCPGTATNPVYIPLGDLQAGVHTIRVVIPQGAPEGSSFSAWNVSGVLLGNN